MVTADFRPEAEFTLFLRMRTKQITGKIYTDRRVIHSPIIGNGRRWSEWQGQIFLWEAPK